MFTKDAIYEMSSRFVLNRDAKAYMKYDAPELPNSHLEGIASMSSLRDGY